MKRFLSILILCAMCASAIAFPQLQPRALASGEDSVVIFSNFNTLAVQNQPTEMTVFILQQDCIVKSIITYHWNKGRGSTPGTIGLVRSLDGAIIGEWAVSELPGMGGAEDVNWCVYPDITLEKGVEYAIFDSDYSTWSQNAQSEGCGFSEIKGQWISSADSGETRSTGDSIPLPTSMKRTTEKPFVLPWPEDPPMEDSGARFSDLAVEVEINTPVGYDANGKEIYNEERWTSAELNHIIPVGTHIRTARNGSAILSFADMTTFVLKPETEIVISSPATKDSQVKLLIGDLWINIKKMMKDGSMEIEMSQAVSGGRGTIFVCEETGTTSKVSVLESKVIFTSKVDGRWVEVLPGESLTATAEGLGQKETFDVAAEAEAWGFDLAEITHGLSEPLRIVSIAAGKYVTLGLRQDGKVMAAGNNESGQCDVGGWTEITAISAGLQHAVGLRRDGTVVAAGINDLGQCDVQGWRDIVAVSAGYGHTVGLKADGTVVAAGYREDGQCDVEGWWDIVAIAAGGWHTLGLKGNGEVIATGYNKYGQCDVADWRGIELIAAGGWNSIGIKGNGQVTSTGYGEKGQLDLDRWKNILTVSASGYHTVGLRDDGTLLAVGNNEDGQCGVVNFAEVAQIAAGGYHTVALLKDGDLAAIGNDDYGQCDLDEWWLWMMEDSPLID